MQDPFDEPELALFRDPLPDATRKTLDQIFRKGRLNPAALMRLLHEVLVVSTAPAVESSDTSDEQRPASDEAQRDRALMPYAREYYHRHYSTYLIL